MCRLRLLVLGFVVVVPAFAVGSETGNAVGSGDRAVPAVVLGRDVPRGPKATVKLSAQLSRLAKAARIAQSGGAAITKTDLSALDPGLQAMLDSRLMRIDDSGRVQVYVKVEVKASETIADIQRRGGTVERSDMVAGLVQARIPMQQLETVARAPSVRSVRLPDYPVTQAGAVNTQGDAILKANLVRSSFSVDGAGVRVGVISDGVGGLPTSQASGDLPSVNTATCNVVGGNPQLSGSEGTAMLEIVHDLAPGAELWFGHFAPGTALDFNAAVDCLAANTDVVVDDLGFLNNGLYDGTSAVSLNTSTELNRTSNRIRVYANAVGNLALEHYQEPFNFCGASFYHVFQATSSTIDLAPFGPRCDDPLLVPAGGLAVIFLQWNDPFGASCNDYDLYLYVHDSATLLAASDDPQTCFQDPTEVIVWQNPLSSDVLVDLAIYNFNAAVRTFDMFTLFPVAPNFLTPCSSVPNQGDAGGGVISTGAINSWDPGNDTIAPYSSCGPTNDGRTKPDITGTDCVSTTGAGGFSNPFCGTSAAAPHMAGIAALLLQCKTSLKAFEPGDNPSADRTALRNGLINQAVDLGAPGMDNVYGGGRADALSSANSVCDSDSDGIPDSTDNCPSIPNASQTNSDGDAFGNACDNCIAVTNASQANSDGDSHGDVCDNCPLVSNANQANFDGDAMGDVCDPDDDNDGKPDGSDPDDDNDRVTDVDEALCGGTTPSSLRPERIDGALAGVDDDGDTVIDEALPGGATNNDCDGDGFKGSAESNVYAGAGPRDQDPCGNTGWPADFIQGGFQPNALNVQDLATYIVPVRRLNTSSGDPGYDVRWDLVPGTVFGETINLQDMAALVAGASGFPPMLFGARAYNAVCPFAP